MPQHAPVRRRRPTAPVYPRRVSGPMRTQALPAGVALPPRTGVFERIRALPDRRVVDRLLRGRLCIWVIGVMLGGIVAMQVSLLKLNSGISRAVQAQDTLVQENSQLEDQVSGLSAYERVRTNAAKDNMIDPSAGDTRFLPARPGIDVSRALKRMKPPGAFERAVMANHGRAPGVAGTTAITGTAVTNPATAVTNPATAVATPAATAVTAAATPVPTATPVVTPVATATVAPAVPGSGAAAAPTPQG
jgi:hypothetical protein